MVSKFGHHFSYSCSIPYSYQPYISNIECCVTFLRWTLHSCDDRQPIIYFVWAHHVQSYFRKYPQARENEATCWCVTCGSIFSLLYDVIHYLEWRRMKKKTCLVLMYNRIRWTPLLFQSLLENFIIARLDDEFVGIFISLLDFVVLRGS